jgi:SAM-dependent methyltransferase
MSRKWYALLFETVYSGWGSIRPKIENETIVDLGCGSVNPYGVLFLLLMLGAKRGIAIDLDEIQDVQQAVQALGDCAAMMLIDPKGLVGDHSISRANVLQNITSFDLGRLGAGDPSGIDSDRLCFRRESVTNLSLSDGEADLVISHTFLEHVPCVEHAIAEMARVTRKGGFGAHLIDGADHRRYLDPNCHALKFLEESTSDTLVHVSNKVRPREFIPVFEHHGFELVEFVPFEKIEVSLELRKQFAEPFRSMPLDSLSVIGARLLVRKL